MGLGGGSGKLGLEGGSGMACVAIPGSGRRSGRPYVAIPGFGGGLGGFPCDDATTKTKTKTETRGAQQPKLMHREEVGGWRWAGREVGR